MSCFVVQSSTLGLKEKKKIILVSSLRTPDPYLLFGDPGLLINLPRNCLISMLSQRLTKGLNVLVNMLINCMVFVWKITGLNLYFIGVRKPYPQINYICVSHSVMTLCDSISCSHPNSSVHGISQARILGWVAMTSSRGSFQPRNWTQVPCIAGGFFTIWGTREAII